MPDQSNSIGSALDQQLETFRKELEKDLKQTINNLHSLLENEIRKDVTKLERRLNTIIDQDSTNPSSLQQQIKTHFQTLEKSSELLERSVRNLEQKFFQLKRTAEQDTLLVQGIQTRLDRTENEARIQSSQLIKLEQTENYLKDKIQLIEIRLELHLLLPSRVTTLERELTQLQTNNNKFDARLEVLKHDRISTKNAVQGLESRLQVFLDQYRQQQQENNLNERVAGIERRIDQVHTDVMGVEKSVNRRVTRIERSMMKAAHTCCCVVM